MYCLADRHPACQNGLFTPYTNPFLSVDRVALPIEVATRPYFRRIDTQRLRD
jgi:hypothetical protein